MSVHAAGDAGGRVFEANRSPFLAIPPELRLAIYEFALLDSTCVTVGHAEVVGRHADVVSGHREQRGLWRGRPQSIHC